MRVKLNLLTLFLLLFTFSVSGQWKQDKFIIGTYLDPQLSKDRNFKFDSLALVLAKEAGFNLLTGYRDDNFIKINRSEEELRYQLKLANKVGLKMIVADERFFHLKPFNKNKAQEVKDFYLNLEDKYRETIYGYRLIDEPQVRDTAVTLPWVKYFRQIEPQKISYVNLLPVYGFETTQAYEDYLKIYLGDISSGKNELQVVSYDFYPFLKDKIRPDYFYNLEQIRKYARGRPIWYYPNISKHLEYIEPKETHLKFESFCPLAYGAKGIIYFSYESVPKQHIFNFSEALINRQGLPTPKYQIVKKINGFINQVAGPVIMNSNYLGTYHVNNTSPFNKLPASQLLNPSTPLLSHITNNNVLTGIFRDNRNFNKFYIFLVNKRLEPISDIDLYFKGHEPKSLRLFASANDNNFLQTEELHLTNLARLEKTKTQIKKIEGGGMVVLEVNMPQIINQQAGNVAPNNLEKYHLGINSFPNPVKDGTLIRYTISKPGPVTVKVFNLLGQEVQSLVEENKEVAGEYFVNLPMNHLAVGLYTCVLATKEGKVATKILKIPG